jgi:low affinity Fe/Cu permease
MLTNRTLVIFFINILVGSASPLVTVSSDWLFVVLNVTIRVYVSTTYIVCINNQGIFFEWEGERLSMFVRYLLFIKDYLDYVFLNFRLKRKNS